jgi:hypothetical protein
MHSYEIIAKLINPCGMHPTGKTNHYDTLSFQQDPYPG